MPDIDDSKSKDRKLGDEWMDWDGSSVPESTDARKRVFLAIAVISTMVLIAAGYGFIWLIEPRLISLGESIPRFVYWVYYCFCGVLLAWLALFTVSVVTKRPISRWLMIPKLVNRLLSIVLAIGQIFNVPRDKLTNSFLKVHNLFLGKKSLNTEAERLLLLLPRCLTKEANKSLREMRDRYRIKLATVGGGSEARKKIREIRPKIIIAVACERDLLSGFKEVNTQIPVIGFPNKRPEGPCKNTCVNLHEIEQTIKNCLA